MRSQQGALRHVKPHGMLYNQAANDPALAEAIARAVFDCNPQLIWLAAGSELIRAGQRLGLTTRRSVCRPRLSARRNPVPVPGPTR